MSDNSSNNKRLAKNTLFLYFRMLFLMAVNLYTSRVTLQVLGVEDFGVYNVVSGIVVMFSFLARAMSGTCTRYMSVAIGKNDIKEVQKVFSNSIVAHLVLMGIVLLLLETVGLWFVLNTLNLPAGRETVANIVYQLAVLSICLQVIRIPFNSSIVANEHMNFYAYSSIVEGVLKLVIVWILLIVPFDKLVSYSLLLVATVAIINLWYLWYCSSHFEGNKLTMRVEKKNLKEMLSFSWWNTLGGLADMTWQQGTNLVLNAFYGVALNAALGITNQVRSAVYTFVTNLQTAANPQIIKAYANNENERFQSLVFSVTKYMFYFMMILSIPIIANVDYILRIWLKTPPEYAGTFCQLILVFSCLGTLGGPVWVASQAKGDVRFYNILASSVLLFNLPVTYILFANGFPPESMLWARIIICSVGVVTDVLYLKFRVGFSMREYLKIVMIPIGIIATIISLSAYWLVQVTNIGLTRLLVSSAFSTIISLVLIYSIGISKSEREIINRFIKKKIYK